MDVRGSCDIVTELSVYWSHCHILCPREPCPTELAEAAAALSSSPCFLESSSSSTFFFQASLSEPSKHRQSFLTLPASLHKSIPDAHDLKPAAQPSYFPVHPCYMCTMIFATSVQNASPGMWGPGSLSFLALS